MQKVLLLVDKISTWVGHAFSFLIVGLTLQVSWEVFSRYALDAPHAWAFDVMAMFYGTLFMMAGAYTLAKNGHVRRARRPPSTCSYTSCSSSRAWWR
jgi:TRAP-type mannitol/chloroaromatic compound transport system permease small subunit